MHTMQVLASLQERLRCIPLVGLESLLQNKLLDMGPVMGLLKCPVNGSIPSQEAQKREWETHHPRKRRCERVVRQ